MEKKVYFMMDNALEVRDKILKEESLSHHLYGGVELEKKSKAKIIDANIKNILKIKLNSIVIINRVKYVLLLRLFGKKVVLIAINSNHDLSKDKKTLKGVLLNLLYKIYYPLCNLVVCISEVQREKLEEVGVKNIVTIPLGVNEKFFKKRKLSKEYYISSGFDAGRNYNFILDALKKLRFKVFNEKNKVTHSEYLKFLAKSKGLVMNINTNNKKSSDLSGTTTCFEALLMKKPIFINYQPWLKELFKENYYVYKDKKELRNLLKRNIKFREIDYSHLTLKKFANNLMKAIKKL